MAKRLKRSGKAYQSGLDLCAVAVLSGENERLQEEIRKLRKYIGQLEDRQEREQCLGELEFLLGETQYNDVEAMAAYFKKSLQLLRQPVRFFSPQTIWGAVPILFCLCFTVRPVRCRKPWMFFRRLWHIITVWCRITVPVLNVYWHRKRIFSAVIGKKRLFWQRKH